MLGYIKAFVFFLFAHANTHAEFDDEEEDEGEDEGESLDAGNANQLRYEASPTEDGNCERSPDADDSVN